LFFLGFVILPFVKTKPKKIKYRKIAASQHSFRDKKKE